MDRRLFVGFPIVVDSSLTAALKRTRISADKKEMEIDWVPGANYHITLCFLGPVGEEQRPIVDRILENVAASSPPISTSIRGLGAFPDDHHMRVLWAGVRKSRALTGLQERLQDALVAEGFRRDERDFVPHLTLGRLKKMRSGKDLLSPYVRTSFGDVDIKEIVLYESLIHGSRPRYEPLRRFELGGVVEEADDAVGALFAPAF
ncbi:MAG: RNA 2',3'-cyclic phosphodiesterase [Bdellovibrionota bacterium]